MIDEQGDLSLVLSPFQFTIGQLVRAIIVSGVVFWLMRMLGGPALLAAFPAIDSLIRPPNQTVDEYRMEHTLPLSRPRRVWNRILHVLLLDL